MDPVTTPSRNDRQESTVSPSFGQLSNFREQGLSELSDSKESANSIYVNDFLKELNAFKRLLPKLYSGKDLEDIQNAIRALEAIIRDVNKGSPTDGFIGATVERKDSSQILQEVISKDQKLKGIFNLIKDVAEKPRTPVFNNTTEDLPLAGAVIGSLTKLADQIKEEYLFVRRSELVAVLDITKEVKVDTEEEVTEEMQVEETTTESEQEWENNQEQIEEIVADAEDKQSNNRIRNTSVAGSLMAIAKSMKISNGMFSNQTGDQGAGVEVTDLEESSDQSSEQGLVNYDYNGPEKDSASVFLISEACKIFNCNREQLIQAFGLNIEEYRDKAVPFDLVVATYFEVVYLARYGLDRELFKNLYAGFRNEIEWLKRERK